MFVLPSGLTVKDFFDAILLEVEVPWNFGKLLNDEDWREHAVNLSRVPPYLYRTLPDPYQFADWREWAMRAYPMMEPR